MSENPFQSPETPADATDVVRSKANDQSPADDGPWVKRFKESQKSVIGYVILGVILLAVFLRQPILNRLSNFVDFELPSWATGLLQFVALMWLVFNILSCFGGFTLWRSKRTVHRFGLFCPHCLRMFGYQECLAADQTKCCRYCQAGLNEPPERGQHSDGALLLRPIGYDWTRREPGKKKSAIPLMLLVGTIGQGLIVAIWLKQLVKIWVYLFRSDAAWQETIANVEQQQSRGTELMAKYANEFKRHRRRLALLYITAFIVIPAVICFLLFDFSTQVVDRLQPQPPLERWEHAFVLGVLIALGYFIASIIGVALVAICHRIGPLRLSKWLAGGESDLSRYLSLDHDLGKECYSTCFRDQGCRLVDAPIVELKFEAQASPDDSVEAQLWRYGHGCVAKTAGVNLSNETQKYELKLAFTAECSGAWLHEYKVLLVPSNPATMKLSDYRYLIV